MPAAVRFEGFRGNSRSRGSLSSTTLKVDSTRWKFRESCETTAAGSGGSERVLLPGFSRCHDLTNTLRQFRVELTSENQSASLKRRLPACLPAIRPVFLRPRDPPPLFVYIAGTMVVYISLVQICEGNRSSPRSTFSAVGER